MRNKCEYIKTVSGYCENQVILDTQYCSYHQKIVDKLIEAPDLVDTLKNMPTMKG